MTENILAGNKVLKNEFINYSTPFSGAEMDEGEKLAAAFYGFLLDHKTSFTGKPLIHDVIKDSAFSEEERSILSKFAGNNYLLYEVKAVKLNKCLLATKLYDGKEYQVFDNALASHAKKGSLFMTCLAPYKGFYFILGTCILLPLEASEALKTEVKLSKERFKQGSPATEAIKIYYGKTHNEKLPPEARFRLLCGDYGISEQHAGQLIDQIKEYASDKSKDPAKLLLEASKSVNTYENSDLNKFAEAFYDFWNSLMKAVSKQTAGPVESTIIQQLMQDVLKDAEPKGPEEEKKANKEFAELLERPNSKLDGRTPKEIILEERRKLGNPNTKIGYKISSSAFYFPEDKAEALRKVTLEGFRCIKSRDYDGAIKVYKTALTLYPNDPVMLNNLSMPYILKLDRKNAKDCLQKALKINPDYLMAKRNLSILENQTDAEISRSLQSYLKEADRLYEQMKSQMEEEDLKK